MGVYIKRMKMPKNCLVCPCTDTEYGECVLDPEKRCPEDYGQRAEWCPLVPIQKHGRLIDADEISYVESENGCQDDYVFRYDINEMPTIIPAEEGE